MEAITRRQIDLVTRRQMVKLGMIDSQVKRFVKFAIVLLAVVGGAGAMCYGGYTIGASIWRALGTITEAEFRRLVIVLLAGPAIAANLGAIGKTLVAIIIGAGAREPNA